MYIYNHNQQKIGLFNLITTNSTITTMINKSCYIMVYKLNYKINCVKSIFSYHLLPSLLLTLTGAGFIRSLFVFVAEAWTLFIIGLGSC